MSKIRSLSAEIQAIREIARRTGRVGLAKSLDRILAQCELDADRAEKQLTMRPVVSPHTGSTPILTWIEQEDDAVQPQSAIKTDLKDWHET